MTISLLDAVDLTALAGHQQVTDAYLLALAAHHGGRLVTFDQRVRTELARGAEPRHLHVLR